MSTPGRTPFDDSVDASSDDLGGHPDRDVYESGYNSPMATRIGDESADDDAERLREIHEGRHHSDGDLPTRQSQWDKTRTAEAICSSLPLARHEREDVVSVVEKIDFSRFGQQKGLEPVTLGAVAVVVDERHRNHKDTDAETVRFTKEFRQICSSLDLSMGDLKTVKKIVRQALEEGKVTVGQRATRRDPNVPKQGWEGYPREFWDNLSSGHWVNYARTWSRQSEEFKQAVPDEYRALIENLRRWEPWQNVEDEDPQEPESGDSQIEPSLDPPPEGSERFDDLSGDAQEEMEQVLDELEEEVRDELDGPDR